MIDRLDDLDMPVLVPSDVRDVWVTGTERSRVEGYDTPAYWGSVEVGPRPGDQDPPWRLTTIARHGCRPGGDGGWTVDPGLGDVAASAVGSLLLAAVPAGRPRDELHRLGEAATDDAGRVAAALHDPAVWRAATLDVDGHRFVLWTHSRDEGFAAVADLGRVLLAAHGRTTPPHWRLTLLEPAAARGRLHRGPGRSFPGRLLARARHGVPGLDVPERVDSRTPADQAGGRLPRRRWPSPIADLLRLLHLLASDPHPSACYVAAGQG